jgi:hydroxymethylbilane synthase
MRIIRIVCRKSQLSLLQAEIVKQKIEIAQPGAKIEIIGRDSRGDKELSVPLTTLEGTDFFTEEIFETLQNGEADIAVHSLKDMSAPHFFSHDAFAVVDRDDARDVAIFNHDIADKIRLGKTIIIGTCSPRREEMAIGFLKKALPQLNGDITIQTRSIRGNVESRLQQLNNGDFDATILATAGLNRLLRSEIAALVHDLLKEKRFMFLPLVECVPAPCQGAIVAEANPQDREMVILLQKINDEALFEEVYNEKREAFKYGTGSLQHFGVTTFKTGQGNILYAAGKNAEGQTFSRWSGLPNLDIDGKRLLSTTDYMGSFFNYEYLDPCVVIDKPVVYVANYKAVQQPEVLEIIRAKRVWTAGTKTWFELAKQGVWVEGSADATGLESLKQVFSQPIINISTADVHILTHDLGARHWVKKRWRTTPTYSIQKKNNPALEKKLSQAEVIFWTSIHQYLQYKDILKNDVIHLSASGETASLLQQQGIEPVVFPNIKAFEQWRKPAVQLLHVA